MVAPDRRQKAPFQFKAHTPFCNSPSISKNRQSIRECEDFSNAYPVEGKEMVSPVCPRCQRFFAACCIHDPRNNRGLKSGVPCHRTRVCFVDGAVSSNGQRGARAGLGCAIGRAKSDQRRIAVDESMDGTNKRTSQRAELLAVLQGIELLASTRNDEPTKHPGIVRHFETYEDPNTGEERERTALQDWLIVSDSDYAVKGCTIHYWKWKKDGAANLETVVNMDLFKKINEVCLGWEAKGYKIGFLWVPREKNSLADSLAKLAIAPKEEPQTSYCFSGYIGFE